jgi:hypothetical protein
MSRSSSPPPRLDFVETFVDALTVRPFLHDLRRMRRDARSLQARVAASEAAVAEFDTATAA